MCPEAEIGDNFLIFYFCPTSGRENTHLVQFVYPTKKLFERVPYDDSFQEFQTILLGQKQTQGSPG